MSTSKLQHYIATKLRLSLGGVAIQENTRPWWLITEAGERLELDIYIRRLSTAIEIQGEQHYRFIPFFHKDHAGFKAQVDRDVSKQALCDQQSVILHTVTTQDEANNLIAQIVELDAQRRSNTARHILQHQIRLIPIGRWNIPDGRKADRSKDMIIQLMRVLASGLELTKDRKHKLQCALRSIASYYRDHNGPWANEDEAALILTAIKLAF